MQQLLFENTADPAWDSDQNHLNIECGFGLFKAIIFNSKNEVIKALALETSGIKSALKETELTQKSYDKVHISLINQYATLVPNQVFEHQELKSYLDYNFEIIENTSCEFVDLKTIPAKNCYLQFEKELKQIFKAFNHAIVAHQSTNLIELNRSEGTLLLIEMHPTHFQILHYVEDQFKLLNSFAYETTEDLLYYITYALRQLKVEKTARVEIAGWINESDKHFTELKKHLPGMRMRTLKLNDLSYGCIPRESQHFFHQVIRQHLCE